MKEDLRTNVNGVISDYSIRSSKDLIPSFVDESGRGLRIGIRSIIYDEDNNVNKIVSSDVVWSTLKKLDYNAEEYVPVKDYSMICCKI